MRKQITLALFFLLCLASLVNAQTEKDLITATIETYFDGWATSDTTKVSKAMHSSCHLKYYRNDKFVDIDKNGYLANFKAPKVRDTGIITEILLMDITGNIAQAKTKIETPKAIFFDYFNLIKTGEGWFIADKISTSIAKQ
jgi:aldose sugar dehydrogenase